MRRRPENADRFSLKYAVLLAAWCSGLLALTGCSGGGGGGGSGAGPTAVTAGEVAAAYSGSRTPAAVTVENAEALAIGAFSGWSLGGSIIQGPSAAETATVTRRGPPFSRTLPGLLRAAVAPARQALSGGDTLGSRETARQTYGGPCGGSAMSDLVANQATGDFSGSLVFYDYCSDGVVMDGAVYVSGRYDAANDYIPSISFWFRSLDVTGDRPLRLHGVLSSTLDLATSSGDDRMDLLIEDPEAGRKGLLEGYRIAYTERPDGVQLSLSGRYYDSRYGFVVLSTDPALIVDPVTSSFTGGELTFSGAGGTWVSLTFTPRELRLEADTDGDGASDWELIDQVPVEGPPVADAGPDQTVPLGSLVTLDGTGSSDPDGDALAYQWYPTSSPDPALNLQGATTALPTFTAARAGTYIFRLDVLAGGEWSTDSVTVTVEEPTGTDPGLLGSIWQEALFGTSIGESGLSTIDLNGDGDLEIVVGGSPGGFWANEFWHVLRRAPGGGYRQVWFSGEYPAAIRRLVARDSDGDGLGEVYVGLENGTVIVYEGDPLAERGRFSTPGEVVDLTVSDLDADGVAEILVTNGTSVRAHSAATHALLWTSPYGGRSLATGNVDDDAATEIIIAADGHGYVLDGVTRALEWDYPNGFGAIVRAADVDGDGRDEVVAASSWYKVTIFDAEIRTPSWEIATSHDVGALNLGDVDGDGIFEIIYGDGQRAGVYCYDGRSRERRWFVETTDSGVSAIAVGDVDGDNVLELVWGAGGNSTGPDYLYIADTATRQIEWQSTHLDGPLSAVAVADMEGDGDLDVAMVSFKSSSGYDDGTIVVWDGASQDVLWTSADLPGIMAWTGVDALEAEDVDGDGQVELLLATADLYDGVLQIYDPRSHSLKRQTLEYYGESFAALAVGDVDGDGSAEVVVGTAQEHSGARGVHLIVFGGATAAEEWKSVDLAASWGAVSDIELADADGDGELEIIAATGDSRVHVYGGATHRLKWLGVVDARAVRVADLDGDGALEILVGTAAGRLKVYDGRTYALERDDSLLTDAPIDALLVDDLDQDGHPDLLACAGGRLSVYALPTMTLRYRSENLGSALGLRNHLRVADFNRDGRKEVVVGSNLAVYQFEVGAAAARAE